MTFLVKTQYRKRSKNDVLLVEEIHPRFLEKRKQVLDRSLPGMPFYRTEHAGVDHSQLQIGAPNARGSNGLNTSTGAIVICDKSAAGVKTCVRKLRPEEAKAIGDIDREIDALKSRIAELREQRSAVVKEAWSKAHVVRLSELDIKEP